MAALEIMNDISTWTAQEVLIGCLVSAILIMAAAAIGFGLMAISDYLRTGS